ncbi:hypothetical protein ILFOPFJJ_03894 [Ensifer psoraleae]|nr:hypothetical protein [Sinorhizobium psoraleae]
MRVFDLCFTSINLSELWPLIHRHCLCYLPYLMDLVLNCIINPGKVFDLEVPLVDVAEGYRAMDERRAIKTLLRV